MEKLQDKVRGCLVGGAVGDALGYPVEFIYSHAEIVALYGDDGIKEFDIEAPYTEAQVSDDTQMTLYTAEGLLEAERNGKPIVTAVTDAYLAWYGRQAGKKVEMAYDSELYNIKEINESRAPGNTCMSALLAIKSGRKPSNASKGCGGVMRVAPVGIFGMRHGWDLDRTARVAGEIAEITHLHPLSTYSSAALAVLVRLCLEAENMDKDQFKEAVEKSLTVVRDVYGDADPSMDYFMNLVRKAMDFEKSPLPDWKIIEDELGGGWVAEETLAIALFSVLRHYGDFTGCMLCSVNHGGDSDSTGAVAGNLIGAIIGYDAIPAGFTGKLQSLQLILSMADRLMVS